MHILHSKRVVQKLLTREIPKMTKKIDILNNVVDVIIHACIWDSFEIPIHFY